MSEIEAIPPGHRLVHIGFFKSGTTALQEALAASREQLSELGVVYPGTGVHHGQPALGITGIVMGWDNAGGYPGDPALWHRLVAEIDRSAGKRAIISAERLEEGDAAAARRVVQSLGPDRTHVVATVRPLPLLLASAWQQHVKNGARAPYDKWLRTTFNNVPGSASPAQFWERHDHPRVLERWVGAAGADRVTLVVLDSQDRGLLYRTFDALLDLPAGTLVESKVRFDNRSMTLPEAELVRRINLVARASGVPWQPFSRGVRLGLVARMVANRKPDPAEPRISTPQWALDRATEFAEQFARDIEALGIHVIGDLKALGDTTGAIVGSPTPPADLMIPVDAAADAALGVLSGMLRRGPDFRPPPPKARRPLTAAVQSTGFGRRVARRLRRAARRN